MEFRSLKALKKHLNDSIKSSIQNVAPIAVKNLMMKHILRDVYMVYKPKIYQRRYMNEGLLDEKNVNIRNRKGNVVEIYNVTKRNLNYSNQYLAPVIEYGHKGAMSKGYRGYSFPNPRYAYYYARPFIGNTRRDLMADKAHVKAFRQGLKTFGIRSEWG